MLTIFNRRELTIPYDTKRQAEIRDLLAQSGIDYYVRVINRTSPSPFSTGSRSRIGTLGENLELENEFVIYVNKSDYTRASIITSEKTNW